MRSLLALMFMSALAAGCTTQIGPGGGGGGGGNGGDDDDDEFNRPDAAVCDQVTPIELQEPEPPDLLLVVDKSGSMAEPLGTGEMKWIVMRTALNNVTTEYERGINFGLMTFPNGSVCDAGTVQADVAPQNADNITFALNLTFPDGGTPTHTTLTGALQYYQARPVNPIGRYVLLATDGQPNCINPADPSVPSINESITAIEALSAQAIPTFVLGFGDGVNSDPGTLQAMANAGGTTNYFAANSPAELQAALDAIADQVAVPDCTFTLDVVPEDPDKLGIFFDEEAVPRSPSHTDGWDYDPASNSITFYGAACDALQSGAVGEVRVDYGCGGPIVL